MAESFRITFTESFTTLSTLLLLVIIVLVKPGDCEPEVEITGFGWHSPQLIFTSRYFFVWNTPVKEVSITSPDNGCRVWQQVFNETNFEDKTLTIVRYKLLSEVCEGLEISLFGDSGQLLARRVVTEDVWSERCVCRRHDWPQLMKCSEMTQQFQQINSDLK